MLLPSVRQLSLADLTPELLGELIAHGESLYVERKVQLPDPPKFGATAASFANTLGGFVLLGVADNGEVTGWQPPGGADAQSHLGAVLRQQVDPLPPFVADVRDYEGTQIGIVRFFESSDKPHIVRPTGAITVRTSKGKEPVAVGDHETVLAMAAAGRAAEAGAGERLDEAEDAYDLLLGWLDEADLSELDSEELIDYESPRGFRIIARAAPLTVTPAFKSWALSERCARQLERTSEELLPNLVPHRDRRRQTDSRARTLAAQISRVGHVGQTEECAVVADESGILGASFRYTGVDGAKREIRLDSLLDDELLPLAQALAGLLEDGEAYGRSVVDLTLLVSDTRVMGSNQKLKKIGLRCRRELVAPADQKEVHDLAEHWLREIRRAFGVVTFEPTPSQS